MTPREFVDNAAALIGLSYAECDCIGVVRRAARIRCQGTNWLWRSVDYAGKYRYLLHRLDRAPAEQELRDGMLVFRIAWNQVPAGYDDKPNCYHVGIISGHDVIQSGEKYGVTRKPYYVDEWQGCGWLRQVDYTTSGPAVPDDSAGGTDDYPSDHDMLCAIYDYIIGRD